VTDDEYKKTRWDGITRPYTKADVERLRGSVNVRHTLAIKGAKDLWKSLQSDEYVKALGAISGQQAVQMAKAGLNAIYVSGWQVASDTNLSGETYPDQSLYPVNSVPSLVRRINKALQRADQIERSEGKDDIDYFLPLIADAEAGFGGVPHAYELMKAMIEAGAAGVHFEDQLGSEKKCGHLGGKVLVPTGQFVKTLVAARLASDVLNVPTVLIGRTDAESATLLTSEIDERDKPFVLGTIEDGRELSYAEAKADRYAGNWTPKGVEGSWTPLRTPEGYFKIKPGIESAIARAISYAPYCDMLWMETKTPNLEEAQKFADAVHEKYPGKLLAYNCSPSFNWKKHLKDDEIGVFQDKIAGMGYKFQFVTLAGFHALNMSMFKLALGYNSRGMAAFSELQQDEFSAEKHGFTAVKHQREVGTGYFDLVSEIVTGGESSTTAMKGSTEKDQF